MYEELHKSMNKKAQIAGQIFVYILAALVIGVMVLIGYAAIGKILPKTCQVESISFKSDIESLVERYNTYGSVNKESLTAPCDYEYICFADSREIGKEEFSCDNKIIENSVKDGSTDNIFVSTQKKTIPIGHSDLIQLDDPSSCTCIQQKSKNFFITFKGQGASTIISEST